MSGTAKQMEMIAALLRQESTLALATVDSHGEPCIAPLFYIAGADLSLFWLSSPSSLHSRNLERAPQVSATVFRHAEKWKDIRGVQMRGAGTVITDTARRKALIKLYCERFQLGSVFRLAIGRSRLYEFRPTFIRYLDNSKRFGYTFEVTIGADDLQQPELSAH
jgi:uncharacterized protein YhbP (UPF0306 family)